MSLVPAGPCEHGCTEVTGVLTLEGRRFCSEACAECELPNGAPCSDECAETKREQREHEADEINAARRAAAR